jgi:hypothetical protein
MPETYILALIGVGIVALVVGILGSLILKALGVLWNKAGGFVAAVVVAGVGLLSFTAYSAKCIEKCEVYETTIGPIFATPKPVPTQTPIYIQVTAAPTPDPRYPCVVVSGANLTCRGLP